MVRKLIIILIVLVLVVSTCIALSSNLRKSVTEGDIAAIGRDVMDGWVEIVIKPIGDFFTTKFFPFISGKTFSGVKTKFEKRTTLPNE